MSGATTRDGRRELQKAAIRDAARGQFMRQGLEATGVREIAAAAGVNPAIVIRHFGSKEALFLEAMTIDSTIAVVLDGPLSTLGRSVVSALTGGGDSGWKTYAALMRASARPDVNALLRQSFEDQIAARLAHRLRSADASLRVQLFTAQLVGLLTAFAMYNSTHIPGASREQVIALYGDAMQHILDS